MSVLSYKTGYRYQVSDTFVIQTSFRPTEPVHLGKIQLDPDGRLTIDKYYSWDGPSGPDKWLSDIPLFGRVYFYFVIRKMIRASLVHDACFQLFRWGKLPESAIDKSNREFQRICREDGISKLFSWLRYVALKHFGTPATRPSARKRVHYAP